MHTLHRACIGISAQPRSLLGLRALGGSGELCFGLHGFHLIYEPTSGVPQRFSWPFKLKTQHGAT